MIRGIHHVALATSDIDRLVKFYQEGFGFEVVATMGWEVGSERIDKIVGLKDSSCRQVMMKAGKVRASGAPREVLTDETMEAVFGCRMRVGVAPAPHVPFVLPQTASL